MRTITSLFTAGLLACSMSAIAADSTDGRSGDVTAANERDSSSTVDRSNTAKPADNRGTGNAAEGRSSDIPVNKDGGSVVRDGTTVGEYNNECAWGLANGKHVQTDCSINMTGSDGKTYCFSSDKAMANFMKDSPRNLSKAKETYGRS